MFIKNAKICTAGVRNFSIIHNYHSPASLFLGNREYIFDEGVKDYNKYIQAFLTKRFTHKKEIEPKIKIINQVETYHNTFYIQKTYPLYNLYDIGHLKYLHGLRIFETGYYISRFFEEYEKPMYDAMLEKVIICGRVPFMEDYETFATVKAKVDEMINKFYNGDKLTAFEREVERAYLYIKQENMLENIQKASISKNLKLKEIVMTYSELNKQSGHINFRMPNPDYFFRPAPLFERIDVDAMFKTLFEMRVNSLPHTALDRFNPKAIYRKMKLKYEYRPSLMEGKHRIEFISDYIFRQIFQYVDSYELHNEFGLGLNFKTSYNIILFHFWAIVQRLKLLNSKFSTYLIDDLITKLVQFSNDNIDRLKYIDDNADNEKIVDYKRFIQKAFDFYTWHFYIFPVTSENNYICVQRLVKEAISSEMEGKGLQKLATYMIENLKHINTRSYEDLESSNFWFTVHRIPINYNMFIAPKDKAGLGTNSYSDFIECTELDIQTKTLENYKKYKGLLFLKYPSDFKGLTSTLAISANKDLSNLIKVDYSQTRNYRWYIKAKNFFDTETLLLVEKAKEDKAIEEAKATKIDTHWGYKENEELGLGYLDKIKKKRSTIQESKDKKPTN
jgi:hypothetical protein